MVLEEVKSKAPSTFKRLQDEDKVRDLARFVIVLTVAALLLNFVSSAGLNMTEPRRHVAQQTNGFIQFLGVNSTLYRHSVVVPGNSQKLLKAREKLVEIGLTKSGHEAGEQFLASSLPPASEEVLGEYLNSLEEQGYTVHYSPALLGVWGEEKFQVDVVPECVGWIGLFAVVALIVAYPHADWKDRVLGVALTVPLMYMVNLFRLTTTIYAGWTWGTPVMEVVHGLLWKVLLITCALVLWIAWIRLVVEPKRRIKR